MSRSLSLLVAVLLVLGLAPAAAADEPARPAWALQARPAGSVLNLRPAPGTARSAGPVEIAALVLSPEGAVQLYLDGQPASAPTTSSDDVTVTATETLAAGDHVAEVRVGGEARRAWRFTVADLAVSRIAGAERIATALAVSDELHPETAPAVVLARADDFADALAGAPLATALGAPLLLTYPGQLPDEVGAELDRLLPETATVTLLGGTEALSDDVADAVAARGFGVERLRGIDRFATAATVGASVVEATSGAESTPAESATAGTPPVGPAESGTVVVASGATFADALAMSGPAARRGWPILLATSDDLPDVTRQALDTLDATRAIVVGGRVAVGDGVVAELSDAGLAVERVAGASRVDTAVAIADRFAADAETVLLASGATFPDALAGGPLAAELGAPVLLAGETLPDRVASYLTRRTPTEAIILGGDAALGAAVGDAAAAAVADAGGPALVSLQPEPGARVESLDQIVATFDAPLDVAASSVYVEVGGQEATGTLDQGDFDDTLVFTVADLPEGLRPGSRYEVRVVVAGAGPNGTTRRQASFVYAEPIQTLARGDEGPAVADLQQRLAAAGYWLGGQDGKYGPLTAQAVMALQKVHELPRDGVYGPGTRSVLESGPARPTPRSGSGLAVEVDKARQVVLLVRDGGVEWIFNTSTGTEQLYTYEGQPYLADTPVGSFSITREVDGVRDGPLGRLYRPKYFHPDGIAVHGAANVPAYPASHGCVRVTNAAMDFLWPQLPIGTSVLVY